MAQVPARPPASPGLRILRHPAVESPPPIMDMSPFPQMGNHLLATDGESNDRRLFMHLNEPFTGACQDCALTCYRIHGTNVDSDRNRPRNPLRPPCFYKLVDNYSVEGGPSCWMKVPVAFVDKYLPHASRKRMVLENRDGWRWHVMYSAAHGFQTGWSTFSTDNELAVGETLFFSMVEEDKFVFHVFDQSGCEKRSKSGPIPSSSEHQGREAVPPVGQTYTNQTPTTSVPTFECFSKFRPNEPGSNTQRELCLNQNTGEKIVETPGAFYGGPRRSDDHNNAATFLNQHNQQRGGRTSKPSTSETRELRSRSVPTARNDIPTPSWDNLGSTDVGSFSDTSRRRGTLSPLKGQVGYLREKRMAIWGPTWSQIRARAALEKAKRKKMNVTDLHRDVAAYKKREISYDNQNSLKRKNNSVGRHSDRHGFEASSGFHGRAVHGASEGRSFSKEVAFVSSPDSAPRGCDQNDENEEERAADLRRKNYTSKGKTITEFIPLSSTDQVYAYAPDSNAKVSSQRHPGGSSHHHQQNSFEIPQFASLRSPRPPRKDSLASPHLERSGTPKPKPKRGRPFKYTTPDSQMRDIFVSRRRQVTEFEIDKARTAAESFASHLKGSTFVLIMRQSFVYRNFVLGVPRNFGCKYMPSCNKDVTLVDTAWKTWFCTWNSAYSYITGRGWRNFALEHCVEEDDALLLHILSKTDTMLTIQVHIFRVVAIPDNLTGWESHICPLNSVPEMHSGAQMHPTFRLERTTQSRRHHQQSAKKMRLESATEVSAMTESSAELD